MKLPKRDDLPAWFLDGVKAVRKCHPEQAEGAAFGRTFVGNGHAAISVAGSTWSLFGGLSELLTREYVVRPLYILSPGLPFERSAFAGSFPVRLGMRMGQCVFVQADYHALVVCAFGPNLEWYGSAPNDPIVVAHDGSIVAVVMPYFETTENDREPYFRKAEKRRDEIHARKKTMLNSEHQTSSISAIK